MVDHDRIAALQEILAANPTDAFARYALGLEYSGSGNSEGALVEFQSLLAAHPEYTNGYFMAAQVLERMGRVDEAREMLTKGIATAQQSNNRHAQSEMQDMLDQLQFRE
jgi:thioredoxin-like negative regulator of GroEL